LETQETADLPGSWGTLLTVRLGLRPGGTDRPGHTACQRGPRFSQQRGLPTRKILSRLNVQAFRLTVYASRGGSPRTTQDSLPAAGQLYRTGFGPAGFRRKVSEL